MNTVQDLFSGLNVDVPPDARRIPIPGGISQDSRNVAPESVFVALRGNRTDGHDYAHEAEQKGASVILSERPVTGLKCANVVDPDLASHLSQVALNYFGHPQERLNIVGVTGTNGKTTTTFFLAHILKVAGLRVGLLGTVEYRTPAHQEAANLTTPDSISLARWLHENVQAGATHVVMEVSSHALSLHRADGIRFTAAALTSFSRDHLDFHSSMEDYLEAKARLFTELVVHDDRSRCVINLDSRFAKDFLSRISGNVLGYSLSEDDNAAVSADKIRSSQEGTSYELRLLDARFEIRSKLIGRYNVANQLAAVGCSVVLGIPSGLVANALNNALGAPGRMEQVENSLGILFVIDYAHTPDALVNVLQELRFIAKRKLICVFGCGGNRDRGKRPLMAQAVERFADIAILTSDNPRKERPEDIINDAASGFSTMNRVGAILPDGSRASYTIEPDRRLAIQLATSIAREGDIVCIAGKGHENYQEIEGVRYQFDDRMEVQSAIRGRS